MKGSTEPRLLFSSAKIDLVDDRPPLDDWLQRLYHVGTFSFHNDANYQRWLWFFVMKA